MKQKVLFFDIDGTLIWSYGGIQEIPQGVQKELKRLKEQGHKLFICSGRPKAMLDQKWWDGTFDGYVLNNGGYVEIDGKSIYENRMDYELCLKTANMLEELHCDYMIATANHLYIDPSYKELYNFFVQNGHFKDLFTTKFDRNEVLKRAIKIEANVTNNDREKIENYIKNDFGYVINFDEHGSDNAFEFYSPTISKATGIQKVLNYYHLDQDDTYAFGDGENDLEMIEFCRVGVAMGNACDLLKAKANIVCKSIVDDGLEDVLKRAIKIEANVTNKDREKIENYIQNDFGYVINFDEHGSDNAFEFYSPTISKATGIQKVLDYYHLDQDDTYAFGDGENDLEMIEFCRVGVAMGNACDVLKEKANIICKSIVDDGLEDVLKILFSE